MSRTKPSYQDEQELTVPCEACGALPGIWCVTRYGRWAESLHGIRWAAWAASPQGKAWQRGDS